MDQQPATNVPSASVLARVKSAGAALVLVMGILLVFERHFRYIASLARQAYLGLAPQDFQVYIYQLAIESLVLLGIGIAAYRWAVRRMAR